jgi:hypothetical protein
MGRNRNSNWSGEKTEVTVINQLGILNLSIECLMKFESLYDEN